MLHRNLFKCIRSDVQDQTLMVKNWSLSASKTIQQQLNRQIAITPSTPQQTNQVLHQTNTQQSSSVKKLKNKLRTTIRLNNKLIKNEITNEIGRFLKRKQRVIKSSASSTKSSTTKKYFVNKYADDFDFSANNSDSDISVDYTSTESISRTTTTTKSSSTRSTSSSSSSSLSTFNSYYSSSNQNSFEHDDLDSSLSSVSSCEFEPFEYSTDYHQSNRSSFNAKKYKFDPISSSSRSNLKIQPNTQEDQQELPQQTTEESVLTIATKTMNFDPFTTSSRKSLALSNEVLIKHVANQSCSCSLCLNSSESISDGNCIECVENQSTQPIQRFAGNICSSTFNSSSIQKNYLESNHSPQINLSLIVNQRLNRSLSSSSSCSSLISSSTLNSTAN